MHYKLNRMYNPELARYMQPDPIGVNGGMNIYSYVENNPLNATDPNGLDIMDFTPSVWSKLKQGRVDLTGMSQPYDNPNILKVMGHISANAKGEATIGGYNANELVEKIKASDYWKKRQAQGLPLIIDLNACEAGLGDRSIGSDISKKLSAVYSNNVYVSAPTMGIWNLGAIVIPVTLPVNSPSYTIPKFNDIGIFRVFVNGQENSNLNFHVNDYLTPLWYIKK